MGFNRFIERHFPGLGDPVPVPVPEKDLKQERIKGLLARYAGIQEQCEILRMWSQDRNSSVHEDASRLETLNATLAGIAEELRGLGVTPPG